MIDFDDLVMRIIAGAFALAGISVIGVQVVNFLYHGSWEPVSLITGLQWLGANSEWLQSPNSWVGLHSVLEFIPLSLTFLITGLGIVIADGQK